MIHKYYKEYEFIDENTLRKYDEDTKMWVTLKFKDLDENNCVEQVKSILRENYINRMRDKI